uniref:DNA repair protein REV1 n=1 Tax=Dendroctonus ponderosae TaxID=77166 RepID=A0AAR5Q402_DENPD
MCGRGSKGNPKKPPKDGFEDWGGYMAAKTAKLLDQFHSAQVEKLSDIFAGVRILVNGFTNPSAAELKSLMAAHGGEYHLYQASSTTHIIASNLPNVKIKQLGAVPIVKPAWITESIALNKLLDYTNYLLYSNQSRLQPALNFAVVPKPDADFAEEEIPRAKSASRSTKTASDPKFLEEFYSNSRLHLISTLGAEFKQLVSKLREGSNGKFPGREKLVLRSAHGNAGPNVPASIVMHIDMDCFFVSVGLRKHPELKGLPVAIAHARSGVLNSADPTRQAIRDQEFALYEERLPEGGVSRVVDIKEQMDGLASMSEIASCSYEARKYGIQNGMFLGQAVKQCPGLKTLPYDFEGYKEVSNLLYHTVASYTLDIEAVSCDEMYVDVKAILAECGLTVEEWASHIRSEIMEVTGCPCSTGFGANRLQARLATRKAKPAGQYHLQADQVDAYMAQISLADLPGVGRATLAKLRNLGCSTCGDLQSGSLKTVQSELGNKLGERIWEQAHGLDNRPMDFNHERKSVSAEINYGIRFKTREECYSFLQSLAVEVFSRLSDIGMKARGLTLKLLVRAEGAPVETAKFLGHGVCDAITKSSTANLVFSTSEVIYKEAKAIYDKLNVSFAELRGVGIQLTKLEKNAPINKAMSNFLKQAEAKPAKEPSCSSEQAAPQPNPKDRDPKPKSSTSSKPLPRLSKAKSGTKGGKASAKGTMLQFLGQGSAGPFQVKREQIDLEVLKELPEDIRNELLKEYRLDLNQQHAAGKSKAENCANNESLKVDASSSASIAKQSPFASQTWEQVKEGIKTWIQSEMEFIAVTSADTKRQLI